MAPFKEFSNWNVRASDETEPIEPYRRYYLICEGANTEKFYFYSLINHKQELKIHQMIDIVFVERTDEDLHMSNPKRLFEHAEKVKESHEDFDPDRDKIVIVFDGSNCSNRCGSAFGFSCKSVHHR